MWRRINALRVLRWCAAALILAQMAAVSAAGPDQADVRVLIDISGSMRQNDPDNLRRPALRMLAGLLQPGTQAGVWTFARWVNNLVPVAEVDAAWKKRIQAVSEQIRSPGQFTNIELVLDEAASSWKGDPAGFSRHLVLLTDGMVDVSKDAEESAQSRDRIIAELLPRLQALGVKVHTIALSARADHELMQQLAETTGGWYQQAAKAEELQRAFLRMFETVGKPDSIPLQDNRFVVDSSISEATVLVFNKPDSPEVILRSPTGEEFRDSDLPGGVAWYRDKGYHLITVDAPGKGEWSLQADVDPDSRVLIVTDLKLRVSDVPTHVVAGEPVGLESHLSNRGKVVTRRAFLDLLEVRGDLVGAEGGQPLILNDRGQEPDAEAGDGRYSAEFSHDASQSEVELTISVDSPTFMREKRFHLMVHEPVEGVVGVDDDGPVLTVKEQESVMRKGSRLTAWQIDETGQRMPLELEADGPGQWKALMMDTVSPAYVQVAGATRLGTLVDRTVGPLMAPGVEPPPIVVAPEPEPGPEPEPEPKPAPPEAEVPAQPESEPEQAGTDWVLPAVAFGVFNLLLAIGVGVWFLVRRRRGKTDDDLNDLVDEIATADAGASKEEAA